MAMPELPDGYRWKVDKLGGDRIEISITEIWDTPDRNIVHALATGGVDISRTHMSGIPAQVEAAAEKLWGQTLRDLAVRKLIEERWPQPQS